MQQYDSKSLFIMYYYTEHRKPILCATLIFAISLVSVDRFQ